MTPQTILSIVLLAPFIAAALSPFAYRRGRSGIYIPGLGAGLSLIGLAGLLLHINKTGLPFIYSWPWVPSLSLNFSFIVDGFGGWFAAMVAFIGVLIVWYAHFYMEHEEGKGRFFAFLLLFLGAMLGVVLSNHIFATYLFWELTSISSFFLIGFWHHKEKSRAGALKALVITSTGGLFMMGGLALLGAKTGIWTWSDLAAVNLNMDKPATTWALGLILIGVFTKSAQFPFHIWLPDAMEAPTPVSAFLHSATMVKAGVFLLWRLYPIFSAHPLWLPVLTIVGLTTFVVGAVLALKHTDLKAVLAYTTIGQLGIFVMMQGYMAWDEALRAGFIFHILVHAFYKGALFMITGIIDHAAHTRDIRKLDHLWKSMPRTGAFLLLAAGSLAGLPPFLGFISKESALETVIHAGHSLHGWATLVPLGIGIGALITAGVAFKISFGVLFASAPDKTSGHHPHDANWGFLIPPAILASAGLIFGLAPGLLNHILYPTALVGIPGLEMPHFALWHGLNLPLAISGIAVVGGAIIFRYRWAIQPIHEKLKLSFNLNTIYDRGWEWILDSAADLTKIIQNGSLTVYVSVFLGFFVGLLGLVGYLNPAWLSFPFSNSMDWNLEIGLLAGIIVSSALVVYLENRLARIVSLSFVGLLICAYFTSRGAPDLALTAFLVEVVMFIVILVVFNQLEEKPHQRATSIFKSASLLVAMLGGGAVGFLIYIALQFPLAPSIAPFFMENSAKMAGGLNVVNVIVVDFRGFDTMGEIAVLCLAGLGIFALRRVWQNKSDAPPAAEYGPGLPDSEILRTASAIIFPIILIFSFYMVLRGHNAPGGGFIGGLITAGGLILEMIAMGRNRFLKIVPFNGITLFTWGLIIAFVTGLAPMFWGYPFLTSFIVESIHFSTASIFDLGVYLVVVGVTVEAVLMLQSRFNEKIPHLS